MSLTNCRFYEEKYPDVDSFVMVRIRMCQAFAGNRGYVAKIIQVNVKQIAEMGAYVKLLECWYLFGSSRLHTNVVQSPR